MATVIDHDERSTAVVPVEFNAGTNHAFLFWGIAVAAQLPLFLLYLWFTLPQPPFAYVVLVLPVVGFLTWKRIGVAVGYPRGFVAKGLFVASFLSLAFGSVILSPWFGAASIFLLATSFLATHGLGYLSIALLPIIKPPVQLDLQWSGYVQSLAARVASFALDLIGVPHLAAGRTVSLADRDLTVAAASGGYHSLYALVAVSLLICASRRRPLTLVPLYLAAAVVISVLGHAIQTVVASYSANAGGADFTMGWLSVVSALSTLLLGALLLWSADYLIVFLFHRIGGPEETFGSRLTGGWDWLLRSPDDYRDSRWVADPVPRIWDRSVPPRGLAIGLGLIGLIIFMPLAAKTLSASGVRNASEALQLTTTRNLPQSIPGVSGFEVVESRVGPSVGSGPAHTVEQWRIELGDVEGMLTLAQPFSRWTSIDQRTSLDGWNLVSVDLARPSIDGVDREDIWVARYVREAGGFAYELRAGITQDGRSLSPPRPSLFGRILDRLTELRERHEMSRPRLEDCVMLHLWVVRDNDLEGQQLVELIDAMAAIRQRVGEQVVAGTADGR